MKQEKNGNTIKLWLSDKDTYDWAHKPGATWPCSILSGKQLFAEFLNGDLVLYVGPADVSSGEFNAITKDFLGAGK